MSHSTVALVTLGMPAYNGARTIRRALASLAAQTWPNFEVIICDDASTDDTVALCTELVARDSRFHLHRNERNVGAWANLAKVMELGRGRYFAWVCPDDAWDPNFVSDLMAALQKEPGAVAAMGACEYFAEQDGTRRAFDVRMGRSTWPQARSPLANVFAALTKTGAATGFDKNSLFLFVHGIVERALYAESVACFDGAPLSERELVSLWALAGKLVYVDKVLFHKDTPSLFDDEEAANRRARSERTAPERARRFARALRTARAYQRSTWIAQPRKTIAGLAVLGHAALRAGTRSLTQLRKRLATDSVAPASGAR